MQDIHPGDPTHYGFLIVSYWECSTIVRVCISIANYKLFTGRFPLSQGQNSIFPSLLHLSQGGATLQAISLCLPKDHLHRDDICLLFVMSVMFNLEQK